MSFSSVGKKSDIIGARYERKFQAFAINLNLFTQITSPVGLFSASVIYFIVIAVEGQGQDWST